jgi:hypothetical protein
MKREEMTVETVETGLLGALRGLLRGPVNEMLGEMELEVPLLDVGGRKGGNAVYPDVFISECERTEKERVIRIDAYSVTITFPVPECEWSDLFCYAYALAFDEALGLNPTLGGIANRAVISGKKYIRPKKSGCGEEWELVITVRVTVENQRPWRNEE